MIRGYSVRRALQSSIEPKSTPSYALVDFGDDGTAVIPFSRIVEGSIDDGKCEVNWSDGNEYYAALIFTGTNKDCISKQKVIERDDSESDGEKLNEDKSNGETINGGKPDENLDGEKEKPKRKRKLTNKDNSKSDGEKLNDDKSNGETLNGDKPDEGNSEKEKPKRKRKLLKTDDSNETKKKKQSNKKDQENEENSKENNDDFILHISQLPPSTKPKLQDITNVEVDIDAMENKAKDDMNITDMELVDAIGADGDSTLSSDDKELPIATKTIVISDSSDIHNLNGREVDESNTDVAITTSLKNLQDEMHWLSDDQEYRFDEILKRIDGIEESLKLLLSSGIASALTSPHTHAVYNQMPQLAAANTTNQVPLTPINHNRTNQLGAANMTNRMSHVSAMNVTNHMPQLGAANVTNQMSHVGAANVINQMSHVSATNVTNQTPQLSAANLTNQMPQLGAVNVTNQMSHVGATNVTNQTPQLGAANVTNQMPPSNKGPELLDPSQLVPLMMKYKTRRSLAAGLVDELVDTETRLRSNVRGRKKDQLDTRIVQYVKRKCFELYPSERDSDQKKDWEDCIVAIDDKARDLKRRLKKQQEQQQSI